MSRLLKWTARIVLVLVAAVVGFVGYLYVKTNRQMAQQYDVTVPQLAIPNDPASLERGRYIATRVSMCTECHGKDLGGAVVEDSFAMGRFVAPNLTRGRGGIGATYSDQDLVRSLLHGVRPDRRSVIFMPSAEFHFTEADLGALIAYLRSLPPIDRELPPVTVGPMARALTVLVGFPLTSASMIDHANVGFALEKDIADPVAAGDKLVAMGGCRGCHGPTLIGGGGPPPGASNITPTGIGEWSRDQFVTAIRDHKRPNGTTVAETMPRDYGKMTDADLHSIYAYLRTVPAAGERRQNQR